MMFGSARAFSEYSLTLYLIILSSTVVTRVTILLTT